MWERRDVAHSTLWVSRSEARSQTLVMRWLYIGFDFESTQLNSTNHPPKWVAYKGKKSWKLIRVPDPWKKQSSFLLKFMTLLKRKNAAGNLFHASIILTEKKYLRIYKWNCSLCSLSSWPLSSVLAVIKKSLCWTLSRPLKFFKNLN